MALLADFMLEVLLVDLMLEALFGDLTPFGVFGDCTFDSGDCDCTSGDLGAFLVLRTVSGGDLGVIGDLTDKLMKLR